MLLKIHFPVTAQLHRLMLNVNQSNDTILLYPKDAFPIIQKNVNIFWSRRDYVKVKIQELSQKSNLESRIIISLSFIKLELIGANNY